MTTSGASVSVLKEADGGKALRRLQLQAAWLQRFNTPNLVKVFSVTEYGYTMEMLDSVPHPDAGVDPNVILNILEREVWSRPPVSNYSLAACSEYLRALPQGERLWLWLYRLPLQEFCDTHGDPTMENLLHRDGVPVLIDPLPDVVLDGKLPSVRALDIGKVMQSLLGYEAVKCGAKEWTKLTEENVLDLKGFCRSQLEWELARCFAGIHIARFIPYQEPAVKAKWEAWLPDILTYLAEI